MKSLFSATMNWKHLEFDNAWKIWVSFVNMISTASTIYHVIEKLYFSNFKEMCVGVNYVSSYTYAINKYYKIPC